MQQEKVTKSTSELQEELNQVKTLGNVFMHYMCTMGLEIIIQEDELRLLHQTYYNAVTNISKG